MKEHSKIEPFLIIALALAVFFLYFLKLGDFGITDPGEGYYVEAAREMVESGNYITPHLNYQIYFSKPILTFWLMAFSYLCLGVNEFAARIPFALIASILFAASYYLGRCLAGPRCGVLSGLIAAMAPLTIAFAKLSEIDLAFTAFLDITLFSACLAALFDRRHWWLAAWFSLGLAFLTKGPAAVILSLLGFAAFVVIERAPWPVQAARLKRLHPLPGFLIFLAVSLPWYWAVANATNGLFLKVFLLYENWARFSGHTNLAQTSWYHYLIVILYGFFPWVLLLPVALPSILCDRNQPFRTRSAILLLACWSAAVFAFFSFSKTQLDTYILPTIAPLAVLLAYYIDRSLTRSTQTSKQGPQAPLKYIEKLLAAIALLSFLGSAALIILPNRFSHFYLPTYQYFCLAALLGTGAVCLGRLLSSKRIAAALVIAFAILVPADTLMTAAAFATMDNGGQKQLRKLCDKLSDNDSNRYRVAIFRAFKPSAMFYMRQPIDSFFHPTQIVALGNRSDNNQQIILAHEKTLPLLTVPTNTKLVLKYKCGQWGAFELIGGEVQPVETLEAMFNNPETFRRAISGKSDWGPLTVPYGSGKSGPL